MTAFLRDIRNLGWPSGIAPDDVIESAGGDYHEAEESEVQTGVAFGPDSGNTGTYAAVADYPAEADVQESVSYGDGAYTGTFVVPGESDVRFGTTYGAAAEYTGTLPAASSTGGDGTLRFGEDGLRSRLLSDATIVGLVGAQIYPVGGVPQGVEMPYGQYQRVDAQHWASISSALGLAQIRVQYDWYSDSLTEVRTLAERARIMLESYAGTISVDGQNVVVRVCRLVDEDSYGEQVGDGADATLWRWRQDYQVVYTEATS